MSDPDYNKRLWAGMVIHAVAETILYGELRFGRGPEVIDELLAVENPPVGDIKATYELIALTIDKHVKKA